MDQKSWNWFRSSSIYSQKTDFDFEIVRQPIGGAGIDATGHPLPEATLKAAREADAILLAAIGSPQYDNAYSSTRTRAFGTPQGT